MTYINYHDDFTFFKNRHRQILSVVNPSHLKGWVFSIFTLKATSVHSFLVLPDLAILTQPNHEDNNVTSTTCQIVNFSLRWHTWPMLAWSCSWDRGGSCSTHGWRVLHLPGAGGFFMSLQQTLWTDCLQQISSTSAICTLTISGKFCQLLLLNCTVLYSVVITPGLGFKDRRAGQAPAALCQWDIPFPFPPIGSVYADLFVWGELGLKVYH